MTDWLDRTLTVCAYYYCLCLNEADFHAKLRQMRLPGHRWSRFLTPGRHATTHHFEHDGKMIAIVCMNADMAKEKTGAQIAALLVHEAVHIWQLHANYMRWKRSWRRGRSLRDPEHRTKSDGVVHGAGQMTRNMIPDRYPLPAFLRRPVVALRERMVRRHT